jgi:hypothetical protein
MLQLNEKPPDPKQEALLQLLCHYLIYIGKVTSLLESSSEEKALVNKWKQQWNKPAAFTWNSSTGLEMHYRIQPPADWIISSSEDESMSSINLDLTDFEDSAEFTINTDLLKCAGCDTFWATLDAEGLCPTCAPPLHEGGSPQSNLDADFYSYFLSDDSIESSFTEFFNMPSLPHSPIANGMKTIERSHGCQKHEADEISNIQQSICPILRDLEPYTYNSTDSGSNLDHQTPQLLQTDQRTRRASPTISDRFETSGDNGQMEAQDATNSTTGHLQHAFETAALKHTSSLCSPARKNTSTAQHFQDLPSLHDDRDFAARSAGQSIVELARCPKCYEKSFPALKGRFSGPICGACRNTSDCSTNPLRFTSEPCTPAPHVDTRYSTAMKDSRTTTPIPQFHKCGPYHSNPVPLPSLVDGATIPLRHPEKCTLQDPNLPIEKTRRRFTCSSCYKVFHRQDNFNRHEKKCGQPRSFATTTSNTTSRVSASIATSGEFSSTAERGNEHTSQWICPRPRCLKICTSERFLREHLRQCHPNNLSIMRPVDQGSTDEPISKTEALDTFPFDDSSQQAKIDDVLPPQHDWPLAECDLFIPPDENWPRELQHDCRTDMLPGLSDQPQNASVAATPFGGLDGSSIQRPRLLI